MSKYAKGLLGVGRLIEKRMIERGIPEKFLSANMYRRVRKGVFEWKNGDQISETDLDQIYQKIWSDLDLHGDRERNDRLFEETQRYRELHRG